MSSGLLFVFFSIVQSFFKVCSVGSCMRSLSLYGVISGRLHWVVQGLSALTVVRWCVLHGLHLYMSAVSFHGLCCAGAVQSLGTLSFFSHTSSTHRCALFSLSSHTLSLFSLSSSLSLSSYPPHCSWACSRCYLSPRLVGPRSSEASMS